MSMFWSGYFIGIWVAGVFMAGIFAAWAIAVLVWVNSEVDKAIAALEVVGTMMPRAKGEK